MNSAERWTIVVAMGRGVGGEHADRSTQLVELAAGAMAVARSDTLAVVFDTARGGLALLVVLLPAGGVPPARLMAPAPSAAITRRGTASARSSCWSCRRLLPLVTVLNPGAEAPWHLGAGAGAERVDDPGPEGRGFRGRWC